MNNHICSNEKVNPWTVRLPNYPARDRERIADKAREMRMSTGAFIAYVLDKELKKKN